MGQGVVIFASGARSKVLTDDDWSTPRPRRRRARRPPARLEGRAGVRVGAADGHRRPAADRLLQQGHGEPDIESLADGGYGTFAEEVRRDGDETRAVDKLAERRAAGCHVLVTAEPTQAFTERRWPRSTVPRRAAGACSIMLGPGVQPRRHRVRARRPGAAGRAVGRRDRRQSGRRSAHASDIEGPWVGTRRPRPVPAAPDH